MQQLGSWTSIISEQAVSLALIGHAHIWAELSMALAAMINMISEMRHVYQY